MTRWRVAIAAVLVVLLLLAGGVWWLARPGPLTLSQTRFDDLPDWQDADVRGALAAFRRGCIPLAAKPPATMMSGAGYAGTVGDWRELCATASGDPRAFFEKNFTPYGVSAGWVKQGLFTGYYEPQIAASPVRGGVYQTPIYGAPPDLVRVDLGAFLPKLKGEHIAGRLEGHRLVPYATRAAIDAHGAAAPVLLYAADPVALFFLQIQGSGRARLPDGRMVRLAYAGENGQPYTAIGRTLIARGALTRETVSMASIGAWLKAHPQEAQSVMETDKSYIFFQQAALGDAALGSPGTLGTPLTPRASLAVDPRLHALGAPFFVAANGADPVRALLIAQDTGGAIRGSVRGDIFFGFGVEAERRAGNMKAPGRLFVLLPNSVAAKIGASHTYSP